MGDRPNSQSTEMGPYCTVKRTPRPLVLFGDRSDFGASASIAVCFVLADLIAIVLNGPLVTE